MRSEVGSQIGFCVLGWGWGKGVDRQYGADARSLVFDCCARIPHDVRISIHSIMSASGFFGSEVYEVRPTCGAYHDAGAALPEDASRDAPFHEATILDG